VPAYAEVMAEELTEDQLNLLRQSFDYARTAT
jgi:hypothetical protein